MNNQLFGSNSSGTTGLLFGQSNKSTNIFGGSTGLGGSLASGPSIFGSNSNPSALANHSSSIFGKPSGTGWMSGSSTGNNASSVFGASNSRPSHPFGIGGTTSSNSPFGLGGTSNSVFGLGGSSTGIGGNTSSGIFAKPGSPFGIGKSSNTTAATSNPFNTSSSTGSKPFGLFGSASSNPFGQSTQQTSGGFNGFGSSQDNRSPFGQNTQNQGGSAFGQFGSQNQQQSSFSQFSSGTGNAFGQQQSSQQGGFAAFTGQTGQKGLFSGQGQFGQAQPQQQQVPQLPPPPPPIPEAPDSLPNLLALLCQQMPDPLTDYPANTGKTPEIDAETELREQLVRSYRESIEAARESQQRQREREERQAVETADDIYRAVGMLVGGANHPRNAFGAAASRKGVLSGGFKRETSVLETLMSEKKGKPRNMPSKRDPARVQMGSGTKDCKIVLESSIRVPKDDIEKSDQKPTGNTSNKKTNTKCFRYKVIVVVQPRLQLTEFKRRCFQSILEEIKTSELSEKDPGLQMIISALEDGLQTRKRKMSEIDCADPGKAKENSVRKMKFITQFSSRSGELDEAHTIEDWLDLSQPIRELFMDGEFEPVEDTDHAQTDSEAYQEMEDEFMEDASLEHEDLSQIQDQSQENSDGTSSMDQQEFHN